MLNQIENEMNAHGFVADVVVADGYVNFTINGAWYSAQVTKTGKLKKGSVRRG